MPIESKKNRPINFLFCALCSPLTSVFDENAKLFGFQGVVPLRNNQISLSKGFCQNGIINSKLIFYQPNTVKPR